MRVLSCLLQAAAALTLAALFGCAAPNPQTVAPRQVTPAAPTASATQAQSGDQLRPEVGPVDLKVMSFNIWLGGAVVDSGQVIEAIRRAEADIVGLQEAEGNTASIAAALGWHASERTMIISRFPLIEPPEADGPAGLDYVYAQIAPGQVVAIANLHLTSDPYGPYAVRDGDELEAVLELEHTIRVPEIEERLAALREVQNAGIPLLVTGDFNTPSHRDWTEATVGALPHMRYAVAWPVTMVVEAAGLVDTFRAANPDPVTNPGRTWSYGYPYPRLDADEAIDRIDFIFATPDVRVIASAVVGESGTPDVKLEVSPYPSDHRAVVTTIEVDPVEPPVFVATERMRVIAGDRLLVRYHAPGGDETDRLAVLAAGGSVPDDELMWLPPQEAEFFGAVRFGTGGLKAGEYAAVLVGADNQELSRSRFWVVAPDALPSVRVAQATYAPGEAITINWANAPAHMRDWVSIYPAGTLDLYNGYLAYAYTGATVAGEYTFDADDLGEAMLPPGEYLATLNSDDGYAILAQVPFTVGP
jgi:endonuclease/exonuclease/phosphatase family metal-dependent hydrolase